VRLLRSFAAALAGLRRAVVAEANFRLHVAAAAVVAALGLWTGLTGVEWALLFLAMAGVLGAEAMNSALERLADALHPKRHAGVGAAKDLAAAAVLLAALGAVGVGLAVFLPHWSHP
jgi:diacylglycerol kinase